MYVAPRDIKNAFALNRRDRVNFTVERDAQGRLFAAHVERLEGADAEAV